MATDRASGASDALEDLGTRVNLLERDAETLRVEWADTIGKLAKLAAKLSVAHKRELDRALGEDGPPLSPTPPVLQAPAPVDRAVRRAQLRAQINSGARAGAVLLAVALAYLLDTLTGRAAPYDVALFPALLGVAAKLGLGGVIKKAGGALLAGVVKRVGGGAAGRAVQAGVQVATTIGTNKAARRILKAGVGAVAAGGAFEAGSRVVRGAPAGAGAVFNPAAGGGIGGGGGTLTEIAPGVESDGRGRMYVRGENGRRRRVTGWDVMGNPVYARPRMNVLNPHALGRANRRVMGFATIAKRTLNHLAQQSRKFAPPRASGRHGAGCKCSKCKAA